eukprot:1157460-Pelagomonas_calceolata.AAC.6
MSTGSYRYVCPQRYGCCNVLTAALLHCGMLVGAWILSTVKQDKMVDEHACTHQATPPDVASAKQHNACIHQATQAGGQKCMHPPACNQGIMVKGGRTFQHYLTSSKAALIRL